LSYRAGFPGGGGGCCPGTFVAAVAGPAPSWSEAVVWPGANSSQLLAALRQPIRRCLTAGLVSSASGGAFAGAELRERNPREREEQRQSYSVS